MRQEWFSQLREVSGVQLLRCYCIAEKKNVVSTSVQTLLSLRLARTELLEIPFENYTLYTFYDVPDKLPPFGLSDHDAVAVQPLARQNLPKNKILLKSKDLRATNRMAMRTYLEEVNLGLLVGLKGSCEEKTRTFETIIKTGMDTLLRPKSKTVIADEPPRINKQLKFPNSRSSNRVYPWWRGNFSSPSESC